MKRNWPIAIAVLAFVLRLAFAIATGALQHPHFWEQEQIATNLLGAGPRREFWRLNRGLHVGASGPFIRAS